MTNGVKDDDQYYISGLFGDAGKLVMLHAFPDDLKPRARLMNRLPANTWSASGKSLVSPMRIWALSIWR